MKNIIVISLLCLIGLSCKKNEKTEELQFQEDIATIEKYLEENNLEALKTESGVYYIINTQGNGPSPTKYSDVKVAYTGYYTNGKTFDQSSSTGIVFNLQQVIQGWTDGIPMFKEGSGGTLLIPSKLGYGPKGNSSIPGNTVLLFDIELLEVIN
jgi:FKBP-type peptidyl-prolyl cis-trans isomerase FkpA